MSMPNPARRRAEGLAGALAVSPAMIAALLDALPDGVIVYGADRVVIAANRAFYALTGSPAGAVGRAVSELAAAPNNARGLHDDAGTEAPAWTETVDEITVGDPPRRLRRTLIAVPAGAGDSALPHPPSPTFIVIYQDMTPQEQAQARADTQARVVAALNAAPSLEATLALATRELRAAANGVLAAIALIETMASRVQGKPSNRLAVAAVDGLDSIAWREARGTPVTSFSPDEGPISWEVLASAQPRYFPVPAATPLHDAGIHTVLMLPLRVGDTALGLAYVGWTSRTILPATNALTFLQSLANLCAAAIMRMREATQREHAHQRSRTLGELNAALYTAEDADAVLQLLVRGACRALEASRAALLQPAGPAGLTVMHEYTAPGIQPATALMDAAESLLWVRVAAQTGAPQPIVVDDITESGALAERWAAVPEGQRPMALLAAPLVEEERLAGLLILHHCTGPRHWEPEEIDFVRTLAAQAGVALRQHRLIATTQADARRLAALSQVAEATIGATRFGAMCDLTLDALARVLETPVSAIHVYDETAPPQHALRLVAWRGISQEAASTWAALPLGAGLVGQAAARRSIVVSEQLADTPSEARATLDRVVREGIEARACAPMLARGRLLGVLTVATHEARAWSGADLSLLQTVSIQLAAALEAEELRRAAMAASAAREADRLKGELLSTVSHELRTPLGAIKGFASGLLHYGDRLSEAQRGESLRAIDEASDRLAELIDNLLDLQRLEAGPLSVAHDLVNLAEVAKTVLAEMTPRAPNHALTLNAESGLYPVRGDARRLRQVMQNLVENAVKYSPGGGRVAVRLAARRDQVELRVEDEGIGVPADQLDLIFERFHRVDSSTTRRIGGTGLGLAIVKGLVAAHHGEIHAESAGEGQGSSFVVILPRAEGGARPGADCAEPEGRVQAKGSGRRD